MAVIKKKDGKETPAISTASLPDIIFILLFFFMVITVMRETEIKVKNKLPQATEVQKLEKKSLTSFIYVGAPIEKYTDVFGTNPRVQLNDQFAKLDRIGDFVESERKEIPEKLRSKITFALRIDENVRMGMVQDVKYELRKANALKINYSARKTSELE